jgi:Protein of unknown function (DUF3631)
VTAAAPPLPPLLPALRALFQGLGADRLPTEAVVAALAERLGGAPITATRLARTLKPYGVAPRQFRVPGSGRRVWGYCLHDLPAAPVEGRDAAPPAESRDSPKGPPAAPLPAATTPGAGGGPAAQPPRDPEQEWATWLAMAAAYRR